jgi:hypothetical protein
MGTDERGVDYRLTLFDGWIITALCKRKIAVGFNFVFSPSLPLRRVDAPPWQLAYVDGGGLVRILFGLPFFALGLYLAAMSVRLAANVWANPPVGWDLLGVAAGVVTFLSICLGFTAFGGWLVLARRGVVFDLREKAVTRWYSLLFYRKSRQYRLADYQAVRVEESGGRVAASPTHAVLLRGDDGQALVVANLAVSRVGAELLAKEIADFLEWPVIEGDSVRPARI